MKIHPSLLARSFQQYSFFSGGNIHRAFAKKSNPVECDPIQSNPIQFSSMRTNLCAMQTKFLPISSPPFLWSSQGQFTFMKNLPLFLGSLFPTVYLFFRWEHTQSFFKMREPFQSSWKRLVPNRIQRKMVCNSYWQLTLVSGELARLRYFGGWNFYFAHSDFSYFARRNFCDRNCLLWTYFWDYRLKQLDIKKGGDIILSTFVAFRTTRSKIFSLTFATTIIILEGDFALT